MNDDTCDSVGCFADTNFFSAWISASFMTNVA